MKSAARIAKFLLQFTIVGLALAFLVVWWRPHWVLGENGPVVQVSNGAGTTASPATLNQATTSFSPAVNQAGPAVVNIHAAKIVEERRNPYFNDPLMERFFGNSGTPPRRILERTLGSGVTVSPDGYIITNHHVIEGAEQIQVALHDGRVRPADIVGTDPETDLAVLKVDPGNQQIPAITLSAGDGLSVGDIVLAIGNPYGIGQTVTMGIVSATGRNELNVATYENFIQTDAAINIGNSGGALINSRGELVGINTAILNRETGAQGISFAIPVQLAADVFAEIVENGRVIRGYLGISSAELASGPGAPAPPSVRGVPVAAVTPGGPAQQAGLRPGDVILSMDGREVNEARSLQNRVAGIEPGTTVTLRVDRNGEVLETRVQVAERRPQGG